MSVFNAFNIVIWIIFIALMIYAQFLKNPLSRSKFTTGDMVRSLGLLIFGSWCLLVGVFEAGSHLVQTLLLPFK